MSRLVCVPPGSCGDPSYLAVLQQLPCQVTQNSNASFWDWWFHQRNNVTQVMVMVVFQKTQDDAECWEERGDKCCYDFSEFNGETLNSIGR